MPLTLSLPQQIAVWILPVLLAITLHEAAHAWVANKCGDTTAKMLGRVSINPLRHVDLVGTILVPLMVGILTQFQFIFGWAKPVPISWSRLHRPRLDRALVSIAGPISNFIMAFLWAICFKCAALYSNPQTSTIGLFLILMGQAGIITNLILGILNLIPIPPLDGSRIVSSLLPPRQAYYYEKAEPFGFIILLALLLSGILGWIMQPVLSSALDLFRALFNI